MKGRIIFVGIHNKPGMEPLDSRTKSGKIIDEVCESFLNKCPVMKTNIFNCEEMPHSDRRDVLAVDWRERVNVRDGDIIVALGLIVKRYLPRVYLWGAKEIYAQHPASRHIKKEEYIKDLINKINQGIY